MNATTLRRFWWIDMPPRGGRISPLLSALLRDGTYLTAWPAVAAHAPAVALLTGFFLGWLRPAAWTTYSFSISLMALFVIVSSASAALGIWTWCGWILGDFFLFSHPLGDAAGAGLAWAIIRVRVPLLISYTLLLAMVAIPFVATTLLRRRSISATIKRAGSDPARMMDDEQRDVQLTLRAVISAGLTFAWTIVVPILIRPVVWWPLPQRTSHRKLGQLAPVEAFAPLQHRGWILGLVALVGMGIRTLLESAAVARPVPSALSLYGVERPSQLIFARASSTRLQNSKPLEWVRLFGSVALGTLLLSGLVSNTREALALAVFLLVDVLVGRGLANVPSWTRILSRISFPMRLVLIALASIALSWLVLAARWDNMQTFLPIITSVGLSLFVSRALLADRLKTRTQ